MKKTVTQTRPILFSSEMVLAILAGRKTMTWRVVKIEDEPDNVESITSIPGMDEPGVFTVVSTVQPRYTIRCPYGIPGDQLWVRETWGEFIRRPGETVYKADDPVALGGSNPWRNAVFMPRHRSRITLEVTGVKVERLQDITEADALAEGVSATHVSGPRFEFAALWIAINGAESWDANPWVWVVSFKRVEA